MPSMSSMTGFLDFELVGDEQSVQLMLERLDTALSPIGMALWMGAVVGPWLRERAQGRFAEEGDDVTGKWKPLAPATQQIRSAGEWPVGPAHPINKRTSELENYITGSDATVVSHTMGSSLTYPGKQTRKKSVVEKVRTAQKGKTNPRTPARPVLGMNERDLTFVLSSLAFHVKGGKAG